MAGNSSFVVDASFVLAFLLESERTEETAKVFADYRQNTISLCSTIFLPFEVLNGLHSALVRHRLELPVASELACEFLALAIPLEEVDYLATFDLATQRNLIFYDASYLALAQVKNVPLLTLDLSLQSLNTRTTAV